MTTHTTRPLRRLAALSLGLLAAFAIAGVAAMALPLLVAVAVGLLAGEAVAVGLEAWDDRWFPDRVLIFEAGLR